ncbi:unnamed protein product [Caenorhabditis brenneri]
MSAGNEEESDCLLEEDKYGRLICRKTRKVYPNGEKLTKENVEEAFNDESPAVSLSSEVFSEKEYEVSTMESNSSKTSEANLFIGGATESDAEEQIGCSGFVIYYRIPENDSVPISLPLMLAYRSSQEGFFHFFISQRSHYDYHRKVKRILYKVECGDFPMTKCDNRRLIPEFFSLTALIKHYKTFVYHDAEKGILETFPLSASGSKKNKNKKHF